jgi:hypothetical protein
VLLNSAIQNEQYNFLFNSIKKLIFTISITNIPIMSTVSIPEDKGYTIYMYTSSDDSGMSVEVIQTNNDSPKTILKPVAEYILDDFKDSPRFDYYISFTNPEGVNGYHLSFQELMAEVGMTEQVRQIIQDYLNKHFAV